MEYTTLIIASLAAIVGMVDGRTRIYGGELADVKDFPYFVRIERDTSPDGSTFEGCGGTLLNPRFVVTAYHCVSDDPDSPTANEYSSYRIFVAPPYTLVNQSNDNWSSFTGVEEIITHPDAVVKNNAQGFLEVSKNDIALIKLMKAPSNLPGFYPKLPTSRPPPGTEGVIVGLGNTDIHHKKKFPLLRLNEFVMTDEECRNVTKGIKTSRPLCATPFAPKAGCRGDSGGPFLSVDESDPILYGVVSFGPSQCHGYDVYTDVSKYVSWIQQVTKIDL